MNLERYINQYCSYHYLIISLHRKESIVVQPDLFHIVERAPELILYKHNEKPCYLWAIDPFCTIDMTDGVNRIFNVPFERFNGFLSYDPRWTNYLRRYSIRSFPNSPELMSHIRNNIPTIKPVENKRSDGYNSTFVFTDDYRIKHYVENDTKNTYEVYKDMINNIFSVPRFEIKKAIFNAPATIVIWANGDKTVVKCGENDYYDPEKGLAMCFAKRALGDKGNYYETFKKWLPEEAPEHEFLKKKFNMSVDLASATDKATEAMQKLSDAIKFEEQEETKSCNPSCHSDVWNAYQRLLNTLNDKKATKFDLGVAMEEAIGYLGAALDE